MIEKIHSTDVIEIVNKLNEVIDFLNDTYLMKVKDMNYITLTDTATLGSNFIAELNESLTTLGDNTTSLKSNIKCPHCGASYYTEKYSESTCVYYSPIWKDGVNINPDRNKITTHCKCLNCGKEFDI